MLFQNYSKADRRAIIALAVAACVIVLGIVLFGTRNPREETQGDMSGKPGRQKIQGVQKDVPTHFDPNTVDSATLVALGLNVGQARTWMRYRASGGRFHEPNDISRLYVLDEKDVARLLPLIQMQQAVPPRPQAPDRRQRPSRLFRTAGSAFRAGENNRTQQAVTYSTDENYVPKFKEQTKVDVNSADTNLLKRIPGVGFYIARWIVERRERLGGFHSVEQLLEVKHVDSEMLSWFEVGKEDIQQIRLDKMTFAEMVRFPYIGYEKAKSLSTYLRVYGPVGSAEELKSSNIFSEAELERLLPYCDFSH